MVAELKALGGLHTLDDFAAQARASYVEPISVSYRGVELVELPPSNQGIVALIMLKMLERLGKPQPKPVSAERYHVLMEAARLAFAMRDAFVADPDMADVPVEHMLDDDGDRRAGRPHRPRSAGRSSGPCRSPPAPTRSTSPSSTRRAWPSRSSTRCSTTSAPASSRPRPASCCTTAARASCTDPAHPNCIAPRKRPMHTLVPAMVLKDGKPHMAFGVMGAHFQPMGHVYVMSNMFDYGMDPQEAHRYPARVLRGRCAAGGAGGAGDVVAGLKRLGHRVGSAHDALGRRRRSSSSTASTAC